MNNPLLTGWIISMVLTAISCGPDAGHQMNSRGDRQVWIDTLFQAAVNNREIPGAVVCILIDNQVVWNKAYGWKNIETQAKLREDDIFRMASMTKALTAVAVLQLVERGRLGLDDPVSRYIPDFSRPNILTEVLPDSEYLARPAKHEITIRQLLTHTSGIGYGFQDDRYNALILKNSISEGFEDDDRTALENIQRLAKIPLLFEPGQRYTYGLSYDVLGVVIEQISGLRYDDYITKFILKPLGMNSSYFIVPESEQHRLVPVYQPTENGQGVERSAYPDTSYPMIPSRRYFSGGADLCSTAENYAQFVQMLLNGGVGNRTRILGKRYVEMMLSKQTELEEGDAYQGFAAWVTNDRGAARGPMPEGTYGFGGFFDTYAWADPQSGMAAVLLLQLYPNNSHNLHQRFQQVVYGVIDDF